MLPSGHGAIYHIYVVQPTQCNTYGEQNCGAIHIVLSASLHRALQHPVLAVSSDARAMTPSTKTQLVGTSPLV
eukprot:2539517-Pyramimonas_sp.AAC.1